MIVLERSQLRTLLGCYCAGAKRPALNISLSSAEINAPHNLHLKQRLAPDEYRLVHRCVLLCEQGLSAARRGDLAAAEQHFAEVSSLLDVPTHSHECRLHLHVLYEKGQGYLDYRRRDFAQAEARMHEALAIDTILEEEYGYTTLHADRLQLVYHLVRLNMKRKTIREGVTLGVHVLNYLAGKSDTLPLSTSWNTAHLQTLPTRLLHHFFAATTVEMACVLAGQQTVSYNGELPAVQTLLVDSERHTQAGCSLSIQAQRWLQARKALGENRPDDFVAITAQELAEGPQNYPLLWYAVIVDLLSLCDSQNVRESVLFRQRVARDSVYWRRVVQIPPAWQQLFDRASEQESIAE